MTEMEPQQDTMDRFLRRSMTAPIPSLPSNFDQRVLREARRRADPRDPQRNLVLAGYGVVSAVACVIILHGQGLGWGATMGMTLAPMAVVAAVLAVRRALRPAARQSAA